VLATEKSDHAADLSDELKSKVIVSLRELLCSGDEVDKCNAGRALGSIGATEAIDDLVSLLRDDDIDVCIDAAEALGKLNAVRVLPQLIDSLKNDPDGELKTAIVRALGEISDPASIPVLLEIAEHHPVDMIVDDNEEWDDWWDMQQQAIIALGKMKAQQAMPLLQNLLADEEIQDIEHEILRALVNMGVNGEQVAIDQLNTGSALSRRRAVYGLSFSTTAKSLKAIASALADASDEVRLAALTALTDRKATIMIPTIELLKRDPSEKVRQASILACNNLSRIVEAETGEAADVRLVVNNDLLKDPDVDVRSTYLQSLQQDNLRLDEASLNHQITTALNDRDDEVVNAAIPLFLKLADSDKSESILIELMQKPKLSAVILSTCIQTLAKLQHWNVRVSRVMTRMINHQDSAIRMASLRGLMMMEENLDVLKRDEIQASTPIDIINEAVNGRVALEIEVASAIKKEDHDQDEIEIEDDLETDSAGAAEPVVAMSTLESILQDNERVEASLEELNRPQEMEADPALDEYRELVQHNIVRGEWLFQQKQEVTVARDVRHMAAKVLSRLPAHLPEEKSTRIINSLLSAINSDDQQLGIYAVDSITQIATSNPQIAGIENCFGGLVTQFHSEQWDMKLACIKALAAIRNQAAIPVLMAALDHSRAAIRIQAIRSITELQLNGNEILKNAHLPEQPVSLVEWVNLLIDSLEDAESGVRYSAVECLKHCFQSAQINQHQALIDTAIEKIVGAAFNNQGGRTRDMALVLKDVAPLQGTTHLLQRLEQLPGSYERRFAIEILEEMYRVSGEVAPTNNL